MKPFPIEMGVVVLLAGDSEIPRPMIPQTYSVSPNSGTIIVDGHGNVVDITFSFNYITYMRDNYIFILILTGAVLISSGAYYFWRKRKLSTS